MKMFSRIKKSKVLSNISWIVIGKIIYMSLNFIVNVICARFLGPSNYGLIGYAASYVTFFTAFCNLGIDSIIVKELLDNKDNQEKVLGTSIGLKFLSSLLSFFAIVFIILVLDSNEPTTQLVVILYSVHILIQIFNTLKFWFQSRLESKYVEIAVTIAYIIMAGYKIYLLVSGKSIIWFSFSNSIELIIIGIILYTIYRRKGGSRFSFSWKYGKSVLLNSYHFIFASFMVAIYNSTDKFMLKRMLNSSEVSYYQTAITIASICTFLLSAIIDSISPIIIEEYNNNNIKKFNIRNVQLYSVVFYISTFTAIFISIFSKSIISLLYGEDYLNSAYSLCILAWYTAFSYLGVARNVWIVCTKNQKYLKYIYVCCAICNVILNYFLIPTMGSTGAAIASLITQISTVLIIPLFIRELRPNVNLILNGILFKEIRYKKK